jgi:hypothetical protein
MNTVVVEDPTFLNLISSRLSISVDIVICQSGLKVCIHQFISEMKLTLGVRCNCSMPRMITLLNNV